MIQDRRHIPHNVAEAMFKEKQQRRSRKSCPREYCDLEYRAIESHPED